jgi:hypothetical protein
LKKVAQSFFKVGLKFFLKLPINTVGNPEQASGEMPSAVRSVKVESGKSAHEVVVRSISRRGIQQGLGAHIANRTRRIVGHALVSPHLLLGRASTTPRAWDRQMAER